MGRDGEGCTVGGRCGAGVDVGVGIDCGGWVGREAFGSRGSVGVEPQGRAVARSMSVWVEATVVVGVRACIVPPGLRCTGSFLTRDLGETASQRSAVLQWRC